MSYKILDVKYELSLCLSATLGWLHDLRWQLTLYSDRAYLCFLRRESCFRGPFFKTSRPLMKLPQENYTLRIIISKNLFFFSKQWRNNSYSGTPLYGHPLYTDSFVCPDKKLIFSLKLPALYRHRLIRTTGHFSVSRVTNSLILSTPLYGHWLSAHCLFSLSQLCDNCRHCTLFK